LLVLALVAGLPGIAGAQFTTFIPQQDKVADSIKAAVASQQVAERDSTVHAQLTNMRTWVDSAAGVTPIPSTAADSLASGVAVADTTTFVNGARAPLTASDLPLLLLAGVGVLLLGVLLLRPDPARQRNRDRS
jgi:hypothetical protein